MSRKTILYWRWGLGGFFVVAGINHFVNPAPYGSMIPRYLPWPRMLVAVSGVAEVLGGVGVLVEGTRVVAGWGLVALLVAVFPANLNVALNGWSGVNLPLWSLWLRLPFQAVFLWWVYRICIVEPTEAKSAPARIS